MGVVLGFFGSGVTTVMVERLLLVTKGALSWSESGNFEFQGEGQDPFDVDGKITFMGNGLYPLMGRTIQGNTTIFRYAIAVTGFRPSISFLSFITYFILLLVYVLVVVPLAVRVSSIAVPKSNCYTLDNSSHVLDFTAMSFTVAQTSWMGHLFEYEGKDSDLVVRFCKDVESRSQTGYIDFGRFDGFNDFVTGSEHVTFVQEFNKGDLMSCEQSYDKLGRTAQVYNGMTQFGFEKTHPEFSFNTEQTRVTLYLTAVASLSTLVQKPAIKVFPEKGLEVRLSGSGAAGRPPTTLSPTVLTVDWTCEEAQISPYEVEISIPVEHYEPINFTLTKICDHRQGSRTETSRGWAIFGIVSCIIFVSLTLFCCGGFIYKSRMQNQRGIDALPGMTYLSAFLQTVSGGSSTYQRLDESNNPTVSQASWSSQPVSQGAGKRSEVRYGSI
ncbi:hypothetical protein KSS87_017883 [Heliosperma pusillum]|nr:hypothetical protein KSS87_002125 [Heliosperma pusillum]KAH9618113.1 hypothetical protein KSS87_017883 [Heliosperma pusillum]